MTWLHAYLIAAAFFSGGFGLGAWLSTRRPPAPAPVPCPHNHHDWDQCPVCCH